MCVNVLRAWLEETSGQEACPAQSNVHVHVVVAWLSRANSPCVTAKVPLLLAGAPTYSSPVHSHTFSSRPQTRGDARQGCSLAKGPNW